MRQSLEQLNELDVEQLELAELRECWTQAWKIRPHPHISRKMLVRSLQFKIRQGRGIGLSYDQQTKLDQLVRAYKRSRAEGSKRQFSIKSGTRFIREYNGSRHVVTVQGGLFEYNSKTYKSLSAIASEISGTRWNGWTFFGVQKPAPDRSGDVA